MAVDIALCMCVCSLTRKGYYVFDDVLGLMNKRINLTHEPLTKYIGTEVERNHKARTIKLKQRSYAENLFITVRYSKHNA